MKERTNVQTPLDKEEKAAKLNLKRLSDKIKLDYSFKRIATLGDYLRAIDRDVTHYRSDELNAKITFAELKEHLSDLAIELSTRYWLKRNPPDTTSDEDEGMFGPGSGAHYNLDQLALNKPEDPEVVRKREEKIADEGEREGWINFPKTSKQKCDLFWFQKRDTKRLIDGVDRGLRAQLLIAQAGHGKTFIAGAFVASLLDRKYHIGKTISPWPYFYVTRASVVEQTKRVLEDKFGIDTISECMVTNYDQLRATLGSLFLEEKTIVEAGIPYRKWIWKPVIHPIVFIFDECQAAKNDSTQGDIVRNVANINSPYLHCVFISATPFTRVSEAEYFVLNCRMNDNII